MNVIPFRETSVVPFPRPRKLVDRRTDRRRYRRRADKAFIAWISIAFVFVYSIGYLAGILSR